MHNYVHAFIGSRWRDVTTCADRFFSNSLIAFRIVKTEKCFAFFHWFFSSRERRWSVSVGHKHKRRKWLPFHYRVDVTACLLLCKCCSIFSARDRFQDFRKALQIRLLRQRGLLWLWVGVSSDRAAMLLVLALLSLYFPTITALKDKITSILSEFLWQENYWLGWLWCGYGVKISRNHFSLTPSFTLLPVWGSGGSRHDDLSHERSFRKWGIRCDRCRSREAA